MIRIKLWLQKPLVKLITIVVCFLLVAGAIFFIGKSVMDYNKVSNRQAQIQKDAKSNNKYFSQLWMKENKLPNNNGIELTYDLYLKKPFIESNELNTELKNFSQTVLNKYNITDNRVRAIGIRIYDRKIIWDKGLQPRAIAFYSVQQEIASKEIQQGHGTSTNSPDVDIAKQDGSTDSITEYNTDSLPQQAWNYSLNNTGKINYQQYDLTVIGFSQYDPTTVTKPLSDQEFAFWLKLKLYEKILDGNNISSAVMLYLNYDLGGNVSYEDFVTIERDFEDFDNRESKMGDTTDFYPNSVTLRQQLAIYRPQLLFYVLSNGQMIKSRTAAQKQLIETQPQVYNKVINDHNKAAAKTTDKYGAQNYYEGDPFVAILGTYKKKYPSFSRPEFSPNLQENSAFFKQNVASGYVN